jgi:hypothetical protein
MNTDKKQPEDKTPQDPLQKINLDDYAGDEEDNRIATEQSNRYQEDLERAKEQKTIQPDNQQPE